MSLGKSCHRGTNCLTEKRVGPTYSLGIIAGDCIPDEDSSTTIPQRHFDGDNFPQRHVVGESPEMSLGKTPIVVVQKSWKMPRWVRPRVIGNRTFANDVTTMITTKNDVTSIVCLVSGEELSVARHMFGASAILNPFCQTSLAFDAIGWDVRMEDTFPMACNFDVESCSNLRESHEVGFVDQHVFLVAVF
ncbi:hypothetical protein Tco_1049816 [Tanacetum coccineum]